MTSVLPYSVCTGRRMFSFALVGQVLGPCLKITSTGEKQFYLDAYISEFHQTMRLKEVARWLSYFNLCHRKDKGFGAFAGWWWRSTGDQEKAVQRIVLPSPAGERFLTKDGSRSSCVLGMDNFTVEFSCRNVSFLYQRRNTTFEAPEVKNWFSTSFEHQIINMPKQHILRLDLNICILTHIHMCIYIFI